mmetsp:Transcript_1227/g.1741  ORF Transcript_1227/g.1741 Transcript_1227/m.1741 type:complete len:139 (+) Transcript_1227:76-492(+)|eukprot:CAMPEP_0184863414 /NCGR_PEP_ID=MMETSP0580-20130426/10976_1 /TAXON_ID=1118495 /ORGANISM="Dactyliosolen fragilissimus" /LENGTH=138 /DNA_ID=CAMNT_0027361727 /DNA_START=50 /DNA_END=466 /DNA_ORIENTATION=+
MKPLTIIFLLISLIKASGFSISTKLYKKENKLTFGQNWGSSNIQHHPCIARQRVSFVQVQTQGLFGLGAAEIGIILVAGALLLGPQNLAGLSKDVGKFAGGLTDLKQIPEEFKKGVEEGEIEARSRKAKRIDPIDSSD